MRVHCLLIHLLQQMSFEATERFAAVATTKSARG